MTHHIPPAWLTRVRNGARHGARNVAVIAAGAVACLAIYLIAAGNLVTGLLYLASLLLGGWANSAPDPSLQLLRRLAIIQLVAALPFWVLSLWLLATNHPWQHLAASYLTAIALSAAGAHAIDRHRTRQRAEAHIVVVVDVGAQGQDKVEEPYDTEAGLTRLNQWINEQEQGKDGTPRG